ncbi:Histone H4 [Mucor velutinosus]|uniref:Histone H4 n=1 Tax=Mucor velutinosus TaxID=708070 RepID=A0AAN7I145_9FUNG|nr:Histone H4 [Mucor velutinosus]
MADNKLQPAADSATPIVMPTATVVTTTPTHHFPLSLSDLNIHSVPNLPDYLKDIYIRPSNQDAQISKMQALIQEDITLRSSLNQTKQQLEDAQKQIQKLVTQQAQAHTTAPESTPTSPPITTRTANHSLLNSPRNQLQPPTPTSPNPKDHLARTVSPNHGYRFVYIPNRSRSPISKMRDGFHAMGIHNRRILDIHFPDRHVCELLIYNDYYTALENQLIKYKLDPISFDPMDTTKLRDPKYAESEDTTFLAEECRRLFLARVKVNKGRFE